MDEVQRKRLEELRQQDEIRARQAQDEADERELAVRELVARLEAEFKGKRGQAFEVVDNPFGLFALREPDLKAAGNYDRATEERLQSAAWQIGVIQHYIHPASDMQRWCEVASKKPGLLWATVDLFTNMLGYQKQVAQKKR